jgi:hypothetical protein
MELGGNEFIKLGWEGGPCKRRANFRGAPTRTDCAPTDSLYPKGTQGPIERYNGDVMVYDAK